LEKDDKRYLNRKRMSQSISKRESRISAERQGSEKGKSWLSAVSKKGLPSRCERKSPSQGGKQPPSPGGGREAECPKGGRATKPLLRLGPLLLGELGSSRGRNGKGGLLEERLRKAFARVLRRVACFRKKGRKGGVSRRDVKKRGGGRKREKTFRGSSHLLSTRNSTGTSPSERKNYVKKKRKQKKGRAV